MANAAHGNAHATAPDSTSMATVLSAMLAAAANTISAGSPISRRKGRRSTIPSWIIRMIATNTSVFSISHARSKMVACPAMPVPITAGMNSRISTTNSRTDETVHLAMAEIGSVPM
ncbi:hypothetical protein NJLHNGOC_11340 [Novacetimonas cocois]|uniref:Uncharacterized protein n=1 Tax=Novacetimonas cocois TaxID=1747507 RepID=A0A365YTR0_9PROT|nr:hypothetical protein NJLHNGOC_11340 [Novacetimonas cocois]